MSANDRRMHLSRVKEKDLLTIKGSMVKATSTNWQIFIRESEQHQDKLVCILYKACEPSLSVKLGVIYNEFIR